MRKVNLQPLSQCFFSEDYSAFDPWHKGIFQTLATGLLHPRIFWGLSTGILLLIGLFSRGSLVLGLTLTIIILYLYYDIRTKALSAIVKAQAKGPIFEFAKAPIAITVHNISLSRLNNFVVSFNFFGSSTNYYELKIENPIPAGDNVTLNSLVICDTGMGNFSVEQLCLKIRDAFGLFEFSVEFETQASVEVLPKIEPIPEMATRGSRYSEMYGVHEMQSRGLSVNFSGVRPYNYGDSVRHIAWRPSAKFGSLIVKEFEKVVSTDATILTDFAPGIHIGTDIHSTWETCKDLTLAITKQMLEKGNSVRFASNFSYFEKTYSQEVFVALSRVLVDFDIFSAANHKTTETQNFTQDPFERYATMIDPFSSLFYITPLNFSRLNANLILLKSLLAQDIEINLVLVNPMSLWSDFKVIDPTLQSPNFRTKLDELLKDLQLSGVHVFMIDLGENFQKGLREKNFLSEVNPAADKAANRGLT